MSRTIYWHVLAALSRAALIGISLWIAFLLRFDFSIPPHEFEALRRGLAVAVAVKLVAFYGMGLHQERWWRYLGFPDLVEIIKANLTASGLFTLAVLLTIGTSFSRSVYCLDLGLCFLLTAGTRFAYRLHEEFWARQQAKGAKGLLIYGAGVAGIALAREIRDNPRLGYQVLGFLDDDPHKRSAALAGLPVLGTGMDACRIVANWRKTPLLNEIAVTMPSATGRQIRAALERARATGLPCRIVPGLGQFISGRVSVGKSEVSVTDLLEREPVKFEPETVEPTVAGKSILVTGAAGSIGSELCRQLAAFNPRCLVTVDQAESEMFRLEAELRKSFPEVNVQPELADIRDSRKLDDILYRHGVDSVFHAAAYKHVPMVERHVCEGARNNVLGTWNLVQAACRNGVSTFAMISTDKAVNPSSVMGLTKRVAELIVTAKRSHSMEQRTRFVSVRFGNVLVSNGSVVPTFQNQIAAGGPVTVTHPEVRRYFMTVQEAVQLVLHASTIGKGSEVFVLEMGKPVRISDLARKMIRLAGFTPDEDIQIQYTGLRPGEKLFEELKLDGEHILPTSHEQIKIFRGEQVTMQSLVPWVGELQHLIWAQEGAAVVEHLRKLVPEYQQASSAVPVEAAEESEPAEAAPLISGLQAATT
ncbi:MAG: nucleoside-diphosphate sugar epimerase/dehydratase [Candidatus Acidiferrum sp.]